MILSKKQQKFWVLIVAISTLALILTSMLPFVYSFFQK